MKRSEPVITEPVRIYQINTRGYIDYRNWPPPNGRNLAAIITLHPDGTWTVAT